MAAVRWLLRRRFRVQAFAAARGFIELSIRLLWAARAPDGWRRFQAYFAHEDRKMAEKCVQAFGLRRESFPILVDPEISELVAAVKLMPDPLQLLKEIEVADTAAGIQNEGLTSAMHHVGQFCFLHPAAHGSPSATLNDYETGNEWHVDVFLAQAAFWTIRAVYHYRGWAPDQIWLRMGTEIERRCIAEGFASEVGQNA